MIVESRSKTEYEFDVKDEPDIIGEDHGGRRISVRPTRIRFKTAVGSNTIGDASAYGKYIRTNGTTGTRDAFVWFTGGYYSVPPPPFVREIARMHGLVWPEDAA